MSLNHTTSVRNPTEERVLKLLGAGYPVEVVASSCGVSASRVSQLLSEDEFKEAVTALRVEALSKHNRRDDEYDEIEDSLLRQLKQAVPMLMRPLEITRVLSAINAAKRRGSSAPEAVLNQQTVVSITMPTQIVQKFTTNIKNQVIQAGSQELLTIQSGALKTMSSQRAVALAIESQRSQQREEVLDALSAAGESDENGCGGNGETSGN